MQMRCCICTFIKLECHTPSHAIQGIIAVNLCIYFPEYALFQSNLGSLIFRRGPLVMSYFCPSSGSKMCVFCHKCAQNIVDQAFQIDSGCWALNASL